MPCLKHGKTALSAVFVIAEQAKLLVNAYASALASFATSQLTSTILSFQSLSRAQSKFCTATKLRFFTTRYKMPTLMAIPISNLRCLRTKTATSIHLLGCEAMQRLFTKRLRKEQKGALN